MPLCLNIPKALRARLALAFTALALAGCDPAAFQGSGSSGPSIDASAPVPVALLVPGQGGQSGDAVVTRSLENAARLAIADLQGVAIDLSVYSTGGTRGGANSAAATAVAEGAKIIIGPLYAEAANGAGLAAAASNVNVLAFSNNPAIAGGNVFILGNTFDNVANRLTDYAARQGKGDILLVNAQSVAEEAGRDAIARAAAGNRANVVGTLSFPLTEAGVRGIAPQIVSQAQATGATSVFFTSGNAGALAFLPQYLREQGMTSQTTQFLGLTRLDIPPEAVAQPALQGAWFALPDPNLNSNFRARYTQAYGGPPHPLAGLAYDGIAAVGALVSQRGADALTRSALTTGSGFVGVNGIFRLRPDGTNERGLAVAQIQNNRVVVIDPAPRRFGGAGF